MVRLKHRWVLFELTEDPVIKDGKVVFPHTALHITEDMLTAAVRKAISQLCGAFGLGMLWGAAVKWYNPTTRIGILRIPRDYTDLYLSTLFFMKQVDQAIPCSFRILHVSGTIIRIQQQAIARDRELYLEEQARQESIGKVYNVLEKIDESCQRISKLLVN